MANQKTVIGDLQGIGAAVVVRGPSMCLSSSQGLGWSNVAIERHFVEAGAKPETRVARYQVTLASGRRIARGERKVRGGHFIPYFKPPGFMNLNAEGVITAINTATPTEIIVCTLDTQFVGDVAGEQERYPASKLCEWTLFYDETLGRIDSPSRKRSEVWGGIRPVVGRSSGPFSCTSYSGHRRETMR